MIGLRPFFSFYGGKWRIAPRYPMPRHPTIIEPFAGSAGYSLRYPQKRVVLVDLDPVVAALWRWLIGVPAKDVRHLPLIQVGQTVDDLDLNPEAKSLIGFWLNKGTASPSKRPSAWMRRGTHSRSFWGPEIRERVASQVDAIRHWRVIAGDYALAPDVPATWFVDPPYIGPPGRHYRYSTVDHGALGVWARSRRGQVIVCENVGATWLPFAPFVKAKGARSGKVRYEAIWTTDNADITEAAA